jgi:hypothetical protein
MMSQSTTTRDCTIIQVKRNVIKRHKIYIALGIQIGYCIKQYNKHTIGFFVRWTKNEKGIM